jgi:hypothetical protein
MVHWKKPHWPMAMGVGLVAGLVLSGFLPYTPLHAVSTDRADTYAIATGPVDNEVEAVYFLDFLTGDLGALVLGKQPRVWSGGFAYNVSRDLAVDSQKNPKYMMITGMAAGLRRAGGTRQQPSAAVCYVAEITSGLVAAYAIPWSTSVYAAGQPQRGSLVLVGPPVPFRQAAGAGPGTGPAAGSPKGKQREKD